MHFLSQLYSMLNNSIIGVVVQSQKSGVHTANTSVGHAAGYAAPAADLLRFLLLVMPAVLLCGAGMAAAVSGIFNPAGRRTVTRAERKLGTLSCALYALTAYPLWCSFVQWVVRTYGIRAHTTALLMFDLYSLLFAVALVALPLVLTLFRPAPTERLFVAPTSIPPIRSIPLTRASKYTKEW